MCMKLPPRDLNFDLYPSPSTQKFVLMKWPSHQRRITVLYLEIIDYFQDLILAIIISISLYEETIYQMNL